MSEKQVGPNERLEELQQSTETLERIIENVAIIIELLEVVLSCQKGEMKALEKRKCPKCGVIHSPYATKPH